jgi:hypothetical protein
MIDPMYLQPDLMIVTNCCLAAADLTPVATRGDGTVYVPHVADCI